MRKANLILPFMILLGIILGCGESKKKPEWQNAKILANKLDHPAAIISDEKFVYFITGGTIASLNEETSGVWKMPLSGGEPVQLFKGRRINENNVIVPDFFVLATDEKYIYWSSGIIWRTPKEGGESQKITSGAPTNLAMDDSKIYWQNFIGEGNPPAPIFSADKTGSESKALTEPLITSGIVVDKDFMFWIQSDGIYKIPKNGGEKSKIYSAPQSETVSGLITDDENFYFTQGNGRNALMKLSKNGGAALKLAPSINHTNKFYADETHIYFVMNETSFSNSLNKVSKNGGDVTKLDDGDLNSFNIGKNRIFVTDITNIYALEK